MGDPKRLNTHRSIVNRDPRIRLLQAFDSLGRHVRAVDRQAGQSRVAGQGDQGCVGDGVVRKENPLQLGHRGGEHLDALVGDLRLREVHGLDIGKRGDVRQGAVANRGVRDVDGGQVRQGADLGQPVVGDRGAVEDQRRQSRQSGDALQLRVRDLHVARIERAEPVELCHEHERVIVDWFSKEIDAGDVLVGRLGDGEIATLVQSLEGVLLGHGVARRRGGRGAAAVEMRADDRDDGAPLEIDHAAQHDQQHQLDQHDDLPAVASLGLRGFSRQGAGERRGRVGHFVVSWK